MAAARWEEARQLYRWYMPLLHLDTHVKFIQYIKVAQQEWGRALRLPLAGDVRQRILETIRAAIAARPQTPDR